MNTRVVSKPPNSEYFNQEFYYSKSRDAFLSIEDMPFQQALFSHRGLQKEFGRSYQGTPLYQKFIQKLCPTSLGIRQQLEKYGKACHVIDEPGALMEITSSVTVRKKFYGAALPGKKVTTHVVGTSVGSYIEATIPVKRTRKKTLLRKP